MLSHVVKMFLLVAFLFKYAILQDLQNSSRYPKQMQDFTHRNKVNCTNSTMALPRPSNPLQAESKSSATRLNVSYLLFTRNNPQYQYDLQPTVSSLVNSTFNPCLRWMILIHGHIPLSKSYALFDVKDELLIEGDYNVVVVNWTHYSTNDYMTSSFQARRVGSDIAKLIQFVMNETGISAESVHVIGHSLGAQVAAFVGKETPNLGRITGLDAAAPIFEYLPRNMRLTDTDAIFVDAMHTNGAALVFKGYGFLKAYAHQDFFPNGGSKQPGCDNNQPFLRGDKSVAYADSRKNKILCNHELSLFYFAESIRDCGFLSVLCDSYRGFLRGQCPVQSSIVAPMGFHAKPIPSLPKRAKFFLRTSKGTPHCSPRN